MNAGDAPTLLFPPDQYVAQAGGTFRYVPMLLAELRPPPERGYEIEVSFEPDTRDDGAFWSVVRRSWGVFPYLRLTDLHQGRLHWHARALLTEGVSPWSEVRQLDVALDDWIGKPPEAVRGVAIEHVPRIKGGYFVVRDEKVPSYDLGYDTYELDGTRVWSCGLRARSSEWIDEQLVDACAHAARADGARVVASGRADLLFRERAPDVLVPEGHPGSQLRADARRSCSFERVALLAGSVLVEHARTETGGRLGASSLTRDSAGLVYEDVAGAREWVVIEARGNEEILFALARILAREARLAGRRITAGCDAAIWLIHTSSARELATDRGRTVIAELPDPVPRFFRIFECVPEEPIMLGGVQFSPHGDSVAISWRPPGVRAVRSAVLPLQSSFDAGPNQIEAFELADEVGV